MNSITKRLWAVTPILFAVNVLRLGEGCLTEISKFAQCLWQLLPNRCYVLGGLLTINLIKMTDIQKEYCNEKGLIYIKPENTQIADYVNWLEVQIQALRIHDVSGSVLSDEEMREPIENALYSTKRFLTTQATDLAEGILEYLKDAGFTIVRTDR